MFVAKPRSSFVKMVVTFGIVQIKQFSQICFMINSFYFATAKRCYEYILQHIAVCCQAKGDDKMESFSLRLRELRNERQLTQKAVAEILHITQQSYLRYELNTGEPSLEAVVVLAKFFDVSTDYLLGLEN